MEKIERRMSYADLKRTAEQMATVAARKAGITGSNTLFWLNALAHGNALNAADSLLGEDPPKDMMALFVEYYTNQFFLVTMKSLPPPWPPTIETE